MQQTVDRPEQSFTARWTHGCWALLLTFIAVRSGTDVFAFAEQQGPTLCVVADAIRQEPGRSDVSHIFFG